MKARNGHFYEDLWCFLLAACSAKVNVCFESEEYVVARQAFVERRKSQFVGA